MAQFLYKARTIAGKLQKGVVEAPDTQAAMQQLREDNLFCFEIKENLTVITYKKVKLSVLVVFCRQLSAMLGAGIGIAESLDTLYLSTTNKEAKKAILSLYEGVLRGNTLSSAMHSLGNTFPDLLIFMVETGEVSGTLDIILETMASHFAHEEQLTKKTQSALIYPAILSLVSLGAVAYLVAAVLPQFVNMYEGVALPAPTRILMGLSSFLIQNWMIIGVAILAMIISFMFATRKRNFRVRLRKIQLKLPIFGKIFQTILTARFASTFSILYASGTTMLRAMEVTSRVMSNEYVEDKLTTATAAIEHGQLLSAGLEQTNIFNYMLLTMVKVGEQSGSLDTMLSKTGIFFKQESETALERMVAMIEPLMIVVFGVIIGFVVLAIMLPIFDMYKSIL